MRMADALEKYSVCTNDIEGIVGAREEGGNTGGKGS